MTSKNKIHVVERIRETKETRDYLKGNIKVTKVLKTDRLGYELHVQKPKDVKLVVHDV